MGGMSRHFIHYLPRQIVLRFPSDPDDPWFAEVQGVGKGFSKPQFHVSRRATGPTRDVKPGDTIWLVSQIHSPWGALPPGIDARIDVKRIEERDDGALRFVAAATSSWFPLADASLVLATLESSDSRGQVSKIHRHADSPIGRSLQSMRRLVSGEPLVAWTEALRPKRAHFISYRICDGTHSAFLKVERLLGKGKVVFWDRWCLPRRLAERREVVGDRALDKHLMAHLRQSKVVWGIKSDAYSEGGSYCAKERAEARRLGTYRAARILPIRKRPGNTDSADAAPARRRTSARRRGRAPAPPARA